MENILAIQIGEEQDMGNGIIDTGQRAVLSVNFIDSHTQHWDAYGDSLYMIWYNVGQLDCTQAFSFFCKQYYNRPMTWWQLAAPPINPLMASSQVSMIPHAPPPPPIASGVMTLANSGYNPLRGYYLTFKGNFDLTCPLFKGFTGINRLVPNYQIRQN
jgi:hypothetical protein